MAALVPDAIRLRIAPDLSLDRAWSVVDAVGGNLHLDHARMHRLVACEPEELPDADLGDFGSTREEAVEFAREVKRCLEPAYRRVFGVPRRPAAVVVPLATRRIGSRARGAGRPAARRSSGAASSSSGSGDDGSGPAAPEPSSRPRRWALYGQSQPTGGRQRAVILALPGPSTGRAE